MTSKMLVGRLSYWSEFIIVCGICWGWFAVRAYLQAFHAVEAPVFNSERLLSLICLESGLALVAFFFLRLRGWSSKDFPIHIGWAATGSGLLLLLITFLLDWVVFNVGCALGGSIEPLREIARTVSVTLPVAIVASLVNGAFEELFLSGYVFKALERHGLPFTLGVSAFLRMFAHIYQGAVGALGILCMGILFGLAYWRLRQLWPLMSAHIAADFLALA